MPSWRDRRFWAAPDPGMARELLTTAQRRTAEGASRRRADPALVEQLSGKELEVLRLMSTKLSRREIAAHLYVSINAVKTHQREVFRKLEVADRAGAGSSSTGARRPVAGCVAMGRC